MSQINGHDNLVTHDVIDSLELYVCALYILMIGDHNPLYQTGMLYLSRSNNSISNNNFSLHDSPNSPNFLLYNYLIENYHQQIAWRI